MTNAQIEEDRRQSDRGDADRRRYERAATDAKASLRVRAGSGVDGHLYNLSAGGCSLEFEFCPFTVGEVVWFKVDSIQPWMGTVRWVSDNKVGIEFDRPFYPAVFDRLVEINKPVSCTRAA